MTQPANKLTLTDITNLVTKEQYHVFEGSTLTVCCLTLKNGFTVTGESACVDPLNFNKELGESIAKKNAIEKIWLVAGYALKEAIFNAK